MSVNGTVEEKKDLGQLRGSNLVGNETNPNGTIVISNAPV